MLSTLGADLQALLPARQRHDWVDKARGLGMLAVVIGHALRGMREVQVYAADSVYGWIEYLIYTFHMPLFFALSGLFVAASVQRGPWGFLASNTRRLLWPYALWMLVTALLIDATRGLVNRPADFTIDGYLTGLIWPSGVFWFLQALFLWHVASTLLLPRLGTAGLLGLGALLFELPHLYPDIPYALTGACRFGMFYVLGVQLGAREQLGMFGGVLGRGKPRSFWVALVLIPIWALLAVEGFHDGQWPVWGSIATLPAAVTGLVAAAGLCTGLNGRLGLALAAIGRHSMAILVMHVMFTAGTRILFRYGLHWPEPAVILPVATLCGVLGPMLVSRLARQFGLSRLIGLA